MNTKTYKFIMLALFVAQAVPTGIMWYTNSQCEVKYNNLKKASGDVQGDPHKIIRIMASIKTTNPFQRVSETRTCLMRLTSTRNPDEIETAIKKCENDIRCMNEKLRTILSITTKERTIVSVALLEGFRGQLKNLQGVGDEHVSVEWVNLESAFTLYTGAILNPQQQDPITFLENSRDLFQRKIKSKLEKAFAVKVKSILCATFVLGRDDEKTFEFKSIKTKNAPIYRDTNIKEWFNDNIKNPILTKLKGFLTEESATLDAIHNITFSVNKFFPLPESLNGKSACINVQNNDDACFAWSVLAALHPAEKSPTSTSSYLPYLEQLKLENITMPMKVDQIPRFETQNKISVNVFSLEKFKRKRLNVVSAYLTKKKQEKHVNLLLIQDEYVDEDGEEADDSNDKEYKPSFHYVCVKDLKAFIDAQSPEINNENHVICDRCLNYFINKQKLEAHMKDCLRMNECKVKLPTRKKANIKFNNFRNKTRAPFIIYADLECLLVPIQDEPVESAQKLRKHVPYSIGYFVKCAYDDSLSFYKSHRGKDCQSWFAQELKQFAENMKTVFRDSAPQAKSLTRIVSNCSFCGEPIQLGEFAQKDYCHFTGRCNGKVHVKCSFKCKDSTTIPVVFHNFTDYDSHFIVKNVAKDIEGRIDLIARNKEQYISFTKAIKGNRIKFRFIDSLAFLGADLGTLASYLSEHPNLEKQFEDFDKASVQLLKRKGVFPYDYMDSFLKFNETNLPDKSKFYNALTDSNITDEDYAHGNHVWDAFGCKNLGEYSDLYLKTDVLLLTEVFEKFRSSGLESYTLDPAHYFTLPGYSWDCMLNHTKINLELLTDIDMVLFVEKGIRGGLCQCSKRYAKANNTYLENYHSDQPSKFLVYFDINNQYGWAMSQYLPYGGFKWVENDLDNFNYNVPANNPEGYILEVDLDYTHEIHDSHSDLPFCPEHRAPPNSEDKKLLTTLHNKEHYIIHYRNLQQATEHGLKVTKIHRVLKFKQRDWLKPYIDYNTQFRTEASNDFESNFYKLMNNAVYGKTMENVRKYSNIKLLTKREGRYGIEAQIARPDFKSSTVFEENFVAIELNNTGRYLNKPLYIGQCVLDTSKTKIYHFHYSHMKERFGDKARLCYTDTDSLIYEVECNDVYETIRLDAKEYFDTSDYPENNIYNIPRVNKKVVGMMKDENAGKVMTEFVGLRPKNYAIRIGTVEKLKGVRNHTVDITFDDYVTCLKETKGTEVKQILFKSENHDVYTIQQDRTVLNPNDDKRYIIPGTYDTLPWGHKSIMELS